MAAIVPRVVWCCVLLCVVAGEYRSLNGTGNNVANPTWGAVGSNADRFGNNYADGSSAMISSLKSAREISNLVFSTTSGLSKGSASRSSLWLTMWAQWIHEDIFGTTTNSSDPAAIAIPTGDVWADPTSAGGKTMSFYRTSYDPATGTGINNPRQYASSVSSFIDCSHIYGTDPDEASSLRLHVGGKMNMSANNLPPMNWKGFPIRLPLPPTSVFAFGDSRSTLHVGVQALHTLFLREHNRWCDVLAARNPLLDDETLFQEARRRVIATVQRITVEEYFGHLTSTQLPRYTGYNASMNPMWDIHASIMFRYAHSEITNSIPLLNENWNLMTDVWYADSYGDPTIIQNSGIEPVLRGLTATVMQEADIYVLDVLRNFVAGIRGGIADLVAFDIQRGRDLGLVTYNAARQHYNLPVATSFADISSNVEVQQRLQSAYGSVDDVEMYVGGMAEDHPGSVLGSLFTAMVTELFIRLRAGDRFWYQTDLDSADLALVSATFLRDVILWNTDIDNSTFPKMTWNVDNPYNPTTASLFAIQISSAYRLEWQTTGESITFTVTLDGTGWAAFGISPEDGGMKNSDIYVCQVVNGVATVSDRYGMGYFLPPADVDVGGTSDVFDVSGSEINGRTTVKFSRRLITFDRLRDHPIENKALTVAFAWRKNSDVVVYHGISRAVASINFMTGLSLEEQTALLSFLQDTKLLHGFTMVLSWGVLIPIGVIIARFFKHQGWWLRAHQMAQIASGASVISMSSTIVSAITGQLPSDHEQFGVIVLALFVTQALFGVASRIRIESETITHPILALCKDLHRLLGYSTMIIAQYNIPLGIKKYNADPDTTAIVLTLYYVWLGIIWGTMFILQIRSIRKTKFVTALQVGHLLPFGIDTSALTVLTYKEFRSRVVNGRTLVICNNLVFDIKDLLPYHPGGKTILLEVLGTDITQDFYDIGTQQQQQPDFNKLFSTSSASSAGGVGGAVGDMMMSGTKQNTTLRRRTPFGAKRLRHRHSPLALRRLEQMVIGKLAAEDCTDWELAEKAHARARTASRAKSVVSMSDKEETQREQDEEAEEVSVSALSDVAFKRFFLVSKEILTPDSAMPMKRFRFMPATGLRHKLMKFLPGQNIIIESRFKGDYIQRNYTPITLNNPLHFDLAVKIYPKGAMTQMLDRLSLGAQVQISGPFGEPLLNSNSPQSKGCWSYLFLIAGGAGITPIIQLIEYHLNERPSNFPVRIVLFYFNSNEVDIALKAQLDRYQLLHGAVFTVRYAVSGQVSPMWNGYTRRFDFAMAKDMFSIGFAEVSKSKHSPSRRKTRKQEANQRISIGAVHTDNTNPIAVAPTQPYSPMLAALPLSTAPLANGTEEYTMESVYLDSAPASPCSPSSPSLSDAPASPSRPQTLENGTFAMSVHKLSPTAATATTTTTPLKAEIIVPMSPLSLPSPSPSPSKTGFSFFFRGPKKWLKTAPMPTNGFLDVAAGAVNQRNGQKSTELLSTEAIIQHVQKHIQSARVVIRGPQAFREAATDVLLKHLGLPEEVIL